MKKTVMLAAIFSWLFVVNSLSHSKWTREVRPLLREGKVWVTKLPSYIVKQMNLTNDTCRYWIKGDTIIGDVTYKKAYSQIGSDEPTYFGGMMEKDGNHKLFKVIPGETTPSLVYDLDDKKFYMGEYSIRGINYFRTEVSRKIGGKMYEVFYLYEEIGSDAGPFSLESDEFLLSCYDGEKCIYQFTDNIEKVTGIRHIRVSSSKSQTVYDLQGRRVENPKQGEIYIQNGKKYINK